MAVSGPPVPVLRPRRFFVKPGGRDSDAGDEGTCCASRSRCAIQLPRGDRRRGESSRFGRGRCRDRRIHEHSGRIGADPDPDASRHSDRPGHVDRSDRVRCCALLPARPTACDGSCSAAQRIGTGRRDRASPRASLPAGAASCRGPFARGVASADLRFADGDCIDAFDLDSASVASAEGLAPGRQLLA